jgi:hypothetical protein
MNKAMLNTGVSAPKDFAPERLNSPLWWPVGDIVAPLDS